MHGTTENKWRNERGRGGSEGGEEGRGGAVGRPCRRLNKVTGWMMEMLRWRGRTGGGGGEAGGEHVIGNQERFRGGDEDDR